jgi:hypothetical protein
MAYGRTKLEEMEERNKVSIVSKGYVGDVLHHADPSIALSSSSVSTSHTASDISDSDVFRLPPASGSMGIMSSSPSPKSLPPRLSPPASDLLNKCGTT